MSSARVRTQKSRFATDVEGAIGGATAQCKAVTPELP